MWKKEVSFSRKRDDSDDAAAPEADAEAVTEETAPAPEEEPASESLWKQELTFRRRVEPDASAEGDVETEPAPVVVAPEPEPVAAAPEPEPTAAADPPAEESLWKQELTFTRRAEPEAAPAIPDVEPEPEPVAFAPEPEPVVLEREPEPVAVQPEPLPPPVVHPPVPAEELGPLPPAAENVPFWKKDISFGGGKKTAKKAPKSKEPKGEGETKLPFWKKDISFGGGKKAPEAEEPTPALAIAEPAVEQDAESEAKVPFWKKDLSFGGGKKSPKEEKPKREKAPKQPKARKAREPRIKSERGAKGGGKRLVGLKIGASQLAAARVSNNGSAELQQLAREALAPGIVVGGELRDPEALADALKDFFDKHKLPKRGVRLGIANNRIGVRTFDIVNIADAKQLDNAIRFRAQEALPIPIDEAVLDYQLLGDGVDQEGRPTKRVLLVVAYRELIDRYVEACKKAGIVLSGIDLEAFALLRALQAPQEGVGDDPTAALVAVAIGHERSTFAVSDGRSCEFTRVLEWGGASLNVALARVLDAAPSEVEDVKHELTLTDSTLPEGLTPEQATTCVEALRKAIQTFARELVSSLQYYQNQPGSLGIGEIVLTGGTAHLPGIAAELEGLIGVRVRVGDPLARMKVSKKVGEPKQIGSLAVAIGLGIED
jgi:type IV pilus assembly protein PilM